MRKQITVQLAFAGLLILFWSRLDLAKDAWRPLGPFGGDVRSLAQDPNHPRNLYLGTVDGQIFSSSDGGSHWQRLSAVGARSDFVVDHILVDPTDSNRLYAGAWSILSNSEGGIYISTDAGRSWRESKSMHGQSVRAMAIAPGDRKVLVAGSLEGVFRSTDAGETWKQISPPQHAEIRNVESIAVDPRNSEIIYAGTWHLPWKTTDAGKTWTHIQRGVVDDSDIFALFIHPTAPDSLLLSACTGIYETSNGGDLWMKFKGIPSSSRRTRAIAAEPKNPKVIYAGTTEGLWKSSDGGLGWNLLTSRTLTVNAILIDSQDPSRILLGTDDAGVLVSTSSGRQLVPTNEGFASRAISSVLFDHQKVGRIFASVLYDHEYGGIFLSDDTGFTWKQANEGLASTDVQVLFQAADDNSIWAGASDGAYLWEPSASRWHRADMLAEPEPDPPNSGTRSTSTRTTRSHPQSTPHDSSRGMGSVMDFSGEPSFGHYFYAATQRGLFVSRDSGTKWKHILISEGNSAGTAVLSLPDGRVFYGTSRGLFASLDQGLDWNTIPLEDGPTPVHKIVALPGDGKNILMATGRGLYRSTDGGSTWSRSKGGLPKSDIADIHVDTRNPTQVFATESFFGIAYLSTDRGETWEWFEPFSGLGLKYKSILADQTGPERFIVVSFREGIYSFTFAVPKTQDPVQ
jgi:photosystem II stability/assembly factor-like uncharacterized protein